MAEYKLHCAIIQQLKMRAQKGVFYFHVANQRTASARTHAHLKQMGMVAGVPDIVILHDGHAYGLEVKRKGAEPDADQYAVAHAWQSAGHPWHYVDNIDDAIAILEIWGVLKPDVYRSHKQVRAA